MFGESSQDGLIMCPDSCGYPNSWMVYSIMDNPIKLDDSILGNLQNPIVDGLIEVIIRYYTDVYGLYGS